MTLLINAYSLFSVLTRNEVLKSIKLPLAFPIVYNRKKGEGNKKSTKINNLLANGVMLRVTLLLSY